MLHQVMLRVLVDTYVLALLVSPGYLNSARLGRSYNDFGCGVQNSRTTLPPCLALHASIAARLSGCSLVVQGSLVLHAVQGFLVLHAIAAWWVHCCKTKLLTWWRSPFGCFATWLSQPCRRELCVRRPATLLCVRLVRSELLVA
jgi:hypothetical protein